MPPVAYARILAVFLFALSHPLARASAAAPDRVLAPVDRARRVSLTAHLPGWANSQNDAGPLPADSPIRHAIVVLSRSPERQFAFERFLAGQQRPGSPDYRRWLTPVEVGERFGASANDIAAVANWLASENLHVDSVSNSRMLIAFSGPAAAVGAAFDAPLHRYSVSGEPRISVASEPSVPAALAPVIRAVSGLYTVRLNPMHRGGVASPRALPTGLSHAGGTLCAGCSQYVFPSDFAAIYNLNPVYSAAITGAGQTIAIIGTSRVDNADIENFQRLSGLPVQDPTVIVPPDGSDPGPPQTVPNAQGTFSEDQLEATLDVTRAGSIAHGATIDLVISDTLVVPTQYVVDANPVPAQIVSISYGACESGMGRADVVLWDTLFGQAAAEGISVFVCSGDSGAAGCDTYFSAPPASQFQNPNGFCSSSYATCMGGTEFADAGNPGHYWSAANGANYESAFGYIPEGAWNEPLATDGSTQAAASGGGVSADIPTPVWQAGVAPGYQGRYTPDISFTSSCHDGYFACFAPWGASCTGQGASFKFAYMCGTSAAAPDMAGIAALVNQKEGRPQGNLNPALYRLAIQSPGVFHDVTAVSSGVANCDPSIPSMCNNSVPSPTALTGGLPGFSVGPGYDEATGLGSIDVAALLANWNLLATPLPATTTSLVSSVNPAAATTPLTLTARVASTDSIGPQGTVSFMIGAETLATVVLDARASAAYSTSGLLAGPYSITAVYAGDAVHAGSASATLSLAIDPQGCTFGLDSTSASFPAAGGSGVVAVTAGAGCFWGAASPLGWVTPTQPASGAGSGVVNYTVAANSGAERTLRLTIAGIRYSVSQAGALPLVSAEPCRVPGPHGPAGPETVLCPQ